jgi:hypothetical protein
MKTARTVMRLSGFTRGDWETPVAIIYSSDYSFRESRVHIMEAIHKARTVRGRTTVGTHGVH